MWMQRTWHAGCDAQELEHTGVTPSIHWKKQIYTGHNGAKQAYHGGTKVRGMTGGHEEGHDGGNTMGGSSPDSIAIVHIVSAISGYDELCWLKYQLALSNAAST